MKFFTPLFTATILLVFSSCNSDKKKSGDSDSVKADTIASTAVLKDSLKNEVYSGYILLKDALVKSDSVEAQAAGAALSLELKNMKGCEDATQLAAAIGNTEGLTAQRTAFITLNAEMIPLFKNGDITTGNLYVQFCPMANNGKGASWLASETEIRNPYYGDEMLTCGEVKETIK